MFLLDAPGTNTGHESRGVCSTGRGRGGGAAAELGRPAEPHPEPPAGRETEVTRPEATPTRPGVALGLL